MERNANLLKHKQQQQNKQHSDDNKYFNNNFEYKWPQLYNKKHRLPDYIKKLKIYIPLARNTTGFSRYLE